VLKITGAADKPLQLIRRYRNERLPNVAVTVDLLTTGVDVHEICNLVFLRRVNSRILFDQMLGRATRRCDEIGKETFRIFDAVRIYEALHDLTAMQPVVVDPGITFTQLASELATLTGEEERQLARDQFLAKLQRKKRHLDATALRDFEASAGMPVDAFVQSLKAMPLADVAAWLTQSPNLGEILDRKGGAPAEPVFISNHADALRGTERGYGNATRPEDYLHAFADFIRANSNSIPALVTVLTRPRDLTRKQLRELALALDKAGFSEANLAAAWREMTNQEIAARIVGYIRQAAIGDPLVPYEQRVERALQKILASRAWTTPQRQWLQKLAAQTKANLIVDRAALDDPDLIFKREGGGFKRLDRIFGSELEQVLDAFNDALWSAPAARAGRGCSLSSSSRAPWPRQFAPLDYIVIYTNQRQEVQMQTAKLFKNGRSQAVRLPAEFRFEGDEVQIRRDPETGDVILSPLNKSFADWLEEHERLLANMTEEERKELDEFLADRDQGEDVERDWP